MSLQGINRDSNESRNKERDDDDDDNNDDLRYAHIVGDNILIKLNANEMVQHIKVYRIVFYSIFLGLWDIMMLSFTWKFQIIINIQYIKRASYSEGFRI